MLEFLLALLTTATVGILLVPLLKPRAPATVARLDNDLAIYRDQLGEIERERAAGLMSEAEAGSAATEIQRRILTAADQDSSGPRASRPAHALHRYLPPALCLLIPLIALGIYLNTGHPGLPSQPFAGRTAEPDDGRPTIAEMIKRARDRLASLPGDAATLSALAELLTAEAQGTVTKEARGLFDKALAAEPADPRAAYYLGLSQAQSGDAKAALERWQALAARHPADAPFQPVLKAEIERVAKEANLPVPEIKTLPAAGPPPAAAGAPPAGAPRPGPTKEQVEAMSRLTPEDRQKTIRAMVEGLAARLSDGPHDKPEDRDAWLRLANARKVLGENDKAGEAFARADKIAPLDARQLADWAEALVRQIQPGAGPSAQAIAVLKRLEQAEPRNALALFYLGAADLAEGRKADAARRWKTLLALLPADAPIRGMLEAKIKEASE